MGDGGGRGSIGWRAIGHEPTAKTIVSGGLSMLDSLSSVHIWPRCRPEPARQPDESIKGEQDQVPAKTSGQTPSGDPLQEIRELGSFGCACVGHCLNKGHADLRFVTCCGNGDSYRHRLVEAAAADSGASAGRSGPIAKVE